MKHTPLTTLAIFSLALVGCGSTETTSDEPQNAEEAQQEYADQLEEQNEMEQPEVQTAGHGTYKLHAIEGAEVEFELPTDPSHELLQDLEQFRQDIDAPPATYIVADVDNRNGTIDMHIPQINVYDPDGNEYTFEAIGNTLLEWEPDYDDSDHYWNTYDQILEFQDELDNGADIAERATTVLIYHGDDLPQEFTRVAVQPYGLGQTEDAYQAE